jgi:DNA-binding transcriptional regulator YiaG
MTPKEFKATRKGLGLSVNQLAAILDVSPVTVRRWEMTSGKASARKPDPIACRVLGWMDSGALYFWGWLVTDPQLHRIASQ